MEVSANQLDNNVFSIATAGCQEVTDSSGDLCDAGVSSQFPSNYNQPPAIDCYLELISRYGYSLMTFAENSLLFLQIW